MDSNTCMQVRARKIPNMLCPLEEHAKQAQHPTAEARHAQGGKQCRVACTLILAVVFVASATACRSRTDILLWQCRHRLCNHHRMDPRPCSHIPGSTLPDPRSGQSIPRRAVPQCLYHQRQASLETHILLLAGLERMAESVVRHCLQQGRGCGTVMTSGQRHLPCHQYALPGPSLLCFCGGEVVWHHWLVLPQRCGAAGAAAARQRPMYGHQSARTQWQAM